MNDTIAYTHNGYSIRVTITIEYDDDQVIFEWEKDLDYAIETIRATLKDIERKQRKW